MSHSRYLPSHAAFHTVDSVTEIQFEIPPDYPFLEGHFPNNPIVPAIAQIGCCLDAIANDLGQPPAAYKISRFKFSSPILPKQAIQIRVTKNADRYTFSILNRQNKVSSGSITLL